MKMKYTLFTLIMSLLSMNAMALEGVGVKLLSETIETSPGAEGGFIPKSYKSDSKSHIVMANSSAANEDGKIRENIRLWGNHSFVVNNYTNQEQYYTYKYELNCDGQYVRKIDHLSVAPGGFARDSGESFLYTYHSTPGTFTINAVTDVTGESSGSHIAYATLKVSK